MIDFRPGQILYLEHQNARLYAETIQVIADRGMCWVRPIALVITPDNLQESQPSLPPDAFEQPEPPTLHDLRQGPDLLCPIGLFAIALDIDLVPILAMLDSLKTVPVSNSNTATTIDHQLHFHLQSFIQALWQAHPEAFRP